MWQLENLVTYAAQISVESTGLEDLECLKSLESIAIIAQHSYLVLVLMKKYLSHFKR